MTLQIPDAATKLAPSQFSKVFYVLQWQTQYLEYVPNVLIENGKFES